MLRLLHYTDAPITAFRTGKIDQTHDRGPYAKPRGTWVSVNESWKRWCTAEAFRQDSLTYRYFVRIHPAATILRLGSAHDLDRFTTEFSADVGYGYKGIDWQLVYMAWDGIIITPYIWPRRLTLDWYYTWDCASGCIWNFDRLTFTLVAGKPA